MHRSVPIIGWSTILLSIIVILTEITGLAEGSPVKQLMPLLNTYPNARTAFDSLEDLFLFNQIWSIYTIIYFCVILAGAVQFVRFRETGRNILETACWIGFFNAFADTFLNYTMMKKMQAVFSAALNTMGAGAGNIFLIGTVAIIFGFFLWIIPSIGMIIYLRSSKLRASMKQRVDKNSIPPITKKEYRF